MRPIPLPRAVSALLLAAAAWIAAACGGKRPPEPGPDVSTETPDARPEPETPARWYWAYVANRESDVVSRVRFGPEGGAYEKSVEVGVMPGETDGPVAVRVSPDGDHWYLATGPASPVASLFKYETGTDRRVAAASVGSSASAVDLTPDGMEAWISGAADDASGRDGDGSALSVVRTDSLRLVARLRVCSRPRAGRVARSGDRLWVACEADDLLVEIRPADRRVVRGLRLTPGAERRIPGDQLPLAGGGRPRGAEPACRPADLVTDDDRVWVACPASDEVVEVHAGDLEVRRRYRVGAGPGALALVPDADLLLAANRDGGTLSVVDVDDGREVARLGTSRARPRGVAVSDDGRYAFVSNAAETSMRSTVDVFDLRAMARVAEVEVEHGAAGVAFWRSAPVKR